MIIKDPDVSGDAGEEYDHMLKEPQGAVGGARRAGEKPSVGILRFGRHELFLALPGYPEWGIGDHVVIFEHSAGAAAGIEQRTDLTLPAKVLRSHKQVGNTKPEGRIIAFLTSYFTLRT